MLCGWPLHKFCCISKITGNDPAPIPKKGFILLIFRALKNISNLVILRFPIPSFANSNQIFWGIISLKRFWISPEKGWEMVINNIETIKTIDGKNHIKLFGPMTNGIEPMIHAQEFLELVKIVAIPTAIKKINDKYFFIKSFDFSRTKAIQNGQTILNHAPA